jgi:RHS repeat-associated protein
LSQNARQRGVTASTTSDSLKLYSYTRYDLLGRITEVGQIKNTTSAFMTETISRNEPTLNSWFSARSNRRGQITNTVYDIGDITLNSQLTAANLRNRVAYTQYTDTATNSSYNQATLYSYDIHGNVDTLLQDYGNSSVVALQNVMNRNANNRWKKIVYGYDLISGKVNWVAYNPKKIDEFFHRYYYDTENRLTTVETSADSLVWERDARYEYYKHGPMARTVIGQQLVQGMDYVYTLQGWLKGVNSAGGSPLGGGGDMGEDGKSNGQNKYIARDAFGYHLNYFTGDYSNINSAYMPFPDHVYKPNGTARLTSAEYRPLYNGNISSMMVNIAALNEPVLHNYRYDQLNRLTGMNTYSGFRFQTNDWGTASDTLPLLRRDATTGDGAYKERIAYDANGNILKYFRKGRWGDTHMDSLTYNYTYNTQGQLQHNKLNFVRDRVNNANTYAQASRDDLEDQATGNYTYDEIGNLIKDTKESITNIKWSVYGKILEITRTATAENTTTNTSANNVVQINYTYDAAGNRISKRVRRSTNQTTFTWYVRDAQGNVMATYLVDSTMVSNTAIPSTNLQQYDVHLYGSSRLGTLYRGIGATTNYTPLENLFFERGNKQYELTNHLGNVLATISDKKKGYDTTGDGQVDYFLTDTRQATDYHPFGWGMIGRSGTYNLFGYKYGFNGKENDKETTTQDYGMRIYDPRLGRFLSVDPLQKQYPELTPYQFASNTPIQATDLDGLEAFYYNVTFDKGGKATLAFSRVQYRKQSYWQDLMDGLINYEPADYSGEKEKLQFNVYLGGKFNSFNTAKELNAFVDKIPVDPNNAKREAEIDAISVMADALKQEIYLEYAYRQDISDGSFNGAIPPPSGLANKTTNKKATEAHNGNTEAAAANTNATPTFTYEGQIYELKAKTPYKRPTHATTDAQRSAVNQTGASCITCGATQGPFNADHKTPLAVEFLSTGVIDKTKMRSVEAVQSQCKTCSNIQGGKLRQVTQKANKTVKREK